MENSMKQKIEGGHIIPRIIIWFFERYAMDYWVDKQHEDYIEEIKATHNLKTEEEIDEFLADNANRPLRKAYEDGVDVGMERAYKEFNKNNL